jgi:nitrogen-specific signal transduction histidine kinase
MLEVSISKKATLNYQFAPDLPPAAADVTQRSRIIMNFIANASDALADQSGTIAISTGTEACDRACLREEPANLASRLPAVAELAPGAILSAFERCLGSS